jgi:hypothetical protein
MEAILKEKLESGDIEGLRAWLSDVPEEPAD